MTDLSPAAQAVLEATSGTYGNYQFHARKQMIAAALRVAASQVMADPSPGQSLLAIAAELGAHHG